MADTIGARCENCGTISRVPATFGGRKAKCPKCAAIFIIPTAHDSTSDIVPDDQLPEVAKEEAPAPEDAGLTATPPRRAPSRSSTSAIRKIRRHAGSAPADRRAPPSKSRTGLVPAIASAAILVVGGVAAGILLTSKKPPQVAGESPDLPARPSEREEASAGEVRARFGQFVEVYNACDAAKLAAFFAPERRKEVVSFYNDIYFQSWPRYENVREKELKAGRETATLEFSFDRILKDRASEKTTEERGLQLLLNWAKRDGVWMIADGPQK